MKTQKAQGHQEQKPDPTRCRCGPGLAFDPSGASLFHTLFTGQGKQKTGEPDKKMGILDCVAGKSDRMQDSGVFT